VGVNAANSLLFATFATDVKENLRVYLQRRGLMVTAQLGLVLKIRIKENLILPKDLAELARVKPGLLWAAIICYDERMYRLTRHEQRVLCIVLALLFIGLAVKTYRASQPQAVSGEQTKN
jgi:hypothetical protein